jgi:hypothetical protein
VILDLPDTVWRLPLDDPAAAIQEYAAIADQLRGGTGAHADLEAAATEAVETALRTGTLLLAVVAPPTAAPAILTAVRLNPASPAPSPRESRVRTHRVAGSCTSPWDPEVLRDSVENVGGPDVRETLVVDTDVGPVVVAQRVPGVEQARAGRPLALQLQAFIPSDDRLLLTLACGSAHGWDAHQLLFCQVVRSVRAVPAPADEESYENHTYRL